MRVSSPLMRLVAALALALLPLLVLGGEALAQANAQDDTTEPEARRGHRAKTHTA